MEKVIRDFYNGFNEDLVNAKMHKINLKLKMNQLEENAQNVAMIW